MSENLKVNAKSSILEFKRKHNKLVDDTSLENFKTKDLVVKTLEQLEYEYSQNIELSANISGLEIESIYNRLVVSDGFMYIILNFKVKNPTENTLSGYSPIIANVELPEKYASKIIDIDGKSVAEQNANKFIACSHAFFGTNNVMELSAIQAQNLWFGINNRNVANSCRFTFVSSTSMSFVAGCEHLISSRLVLSLK